MDCSTPGFPVYHQLSDLAQTHVHQVSDAIQPPHPLLSPSPVFNLSQHQGFSNESVLCIRWPKYSGATASSSVLPMNIQDSCPLGWTIFISLLSKGVVYMCQPQSPNSSRPTSSPSVSTCLFSMCTSLYLFRGMCSASR